MNKKIIRYDIKKKLNYYLEKITGSSNHPRWDNHSSELESKDPNDILNGRVVHDNNKEEYIG